jgi:hypothetical protein
MYSLYFIEFHLLNISHKMILFVYDVPLTKSFLVSLTRHRGRWYSVSVIFRVPPGKICFI